MVEYNALLTTGLIGFGVGVVTTLVLVLLIVIYNNIKSAKENNQEDDGGMIVPLSSLLGGGGGGGPPISMADIMKLKAAMAAQGMPPQPGDEKKSDASVGNYI